MRTSVEKKSRQTHLTNRTRLWYDVENERCGSSVHGEADWNNERGVIMGILNILGYIGVGLGVALVLLLISYLWSRPKETVPYEDGSMQKQRGEGDWGVASFFAGFVLCVISTLLLYNLAHFSILKSIGLGLVSGIAVAILLIIIWVIVTKNKGEAKKAFFPFTLVNSILSGAGFAVLASVWGWF